MVKLYVEGGGDTAALRAACRKGFRIFLEKAGLGKRPRVVACGSRRDAYESFRTSIENGEDAVLLVDSEDKIQTVNQQGDAASWRPWHHLKHRHGDRWGKPGQSHETDCHLMVVCMESWFVADRNSLSSFFGVGFNSNQLPPLGRSIESIDKSDIYNVLARSTQGCKTKLPYGKGEHSFKLL